MEIQVPEAKDTLDALHNRDGAVEIISEVKRFSPSKGTLVAIPDLAAFASTYEAGGTSIVSVLIEQRHFDGSFADLDAVRAAVDIPILRRDFIVTPYRTHETRTYGADLVLLIVAVLEQNVLVSLLERARSFSMEALVEMHSRFEALRVVKAGASITDVNARNLKTLKADRSAIEQVIDAIPQDVVAVAESGVANAHDVFECAKWGVDAVSVGEALATSGDPYVSIQDMMSAGQYPALRMDCKTRTAAARQEGQ